MSIAYITYFGLARLLSHLTRPRPAAGVELGRYRFDRKARAWIPRETRPRRPAGLTHPSPRISVDSGRTAPYPKEDSIIRIPSIQ